MEIKYDVFLNFLKMYLFFITTFALIPAILGIHTGLHVIYIKILDSIFKYANRDSATTESNLLPRSCSTIEFGEMNKKRFHLADICYFLTTGFSAIMDDDITQRFRHQHCDHWNLLVRSYRENGTDGLKKYALWILGILFRYGFLMPNRFVVLIFAFCLLFLGRIFFPLFPPCRRKDIISAKFNQICCRLITKGLGLHTKFHFRNNIAKYGIAVSNHTTPLDAIILCSNGNFRLTGQLQPGFFGLIENFLVQLGHIFFDREAYQDRNIVLKRLKEHANDTELPPILIFPEGTCINNTCIMMFRKGSFEYSDIVHPIAVKYNSVYGDSFWDSSSESFVKYLMKIVTSWIIVADVWYLPTIKRQPNENSAQMASRVQLEIAEQCGVEALYWDGALKRSPVPESLKKRIQKEFVDSIIIEP